MAANAYNYGQPTGYRFPQPLLTSACPLPSTQPFPNYSTPSQTYGIPGPQCPLYQDFPHNSEPPTKRARMHSNLDEATPTNLNQTGRTDQQSSQPKSFTSSNGNSARPLPEGRSGQQSSSTLEEKSRGLRNHNDQTPNRAPVAPASTPVSMAAASTSPPRRRHHPPGQLSTQFGVSSRDGKLKRNCEYCFQKRRKCSRNYPCDECLMEGVICTPITRARKPLMGRTHGDREQLSGSESDGQPDDEQVPEPAAFNPSGRREADGSIRKELSRMGVVVGNHQEWSNMRLEYHPFPPDVDEVRDKLFVLDKPMLFNSQHWANYYPHMTNMYSRQVKPSLQANGITVEFWNCRNAARRLRKMRATERPSTEDNRHEPIRTRNRKMKIDLFESDTPCKMRIRILYYMKHASTEDEKHTSGLGSCRCVPEWVHLQQSEKVVADGLKHNHPLVLLDRFKRSDALLYFAGYKLEEGAYMNSAVLQWMKTKYGEVTKQVEFLTISDISNATRHWRKLHPTVELIETIPDEDRAIEAQKRCLDMVATTSSAGLRKTLEELFKRFPGAIEIAQPILEAAQEEEMPAPQPTCTIQEGEDIKIPYPGLPSNMDESNGYVRGTGRASFAHGHQSLPINPVFQQGGFITLVPRGSSQVSVHEAKRPEKQHGPELSAPAPPPAACYQGSPQPAGPLLWQPQPPAPNQHPPAPRGHPPTQTPPPQHPPHVRPPEGSPPGADPRGFAYPPPPHQYQPIHTTHYQMAYTPVDARPAWATPQRPAAPAQSSKESRNQTSFGGTTNRDAKMMYKEAVQKQLDDELKR